MGKPLFCRFPFPDDPVVLQRALADMGYQKVHIQDLNTLASMQPGPGEAAHPDARFVARAEIGSIAQA